METNKATEAKDLRNICIMAHVDHGKTTLADSLIASNGIITPRQAGKLRYMDSRKDEVERGITMKSSCVTLTHTYRSSNYVINLIDSPGHVDFSSEVSTALRLCDGAIIVVDLIEGVCAQTKVVLRQAWMENIQAVLVLNKIDRLINEMKFTALDAYYHLCRTLEQVNAYIGELYNTDVFDRMAEEEKQKKENKGKNRVLYSKLDDIEDDSNVYFSPENENVLFASAYDGWGFRIHEFAESFHEKLGVSQEDLKMGLWGNYFIAKKEGKKVVYSGAKERNKTPLFVSIILDNIYRVYETVTNKKNITEIEKICHSLNIKLPTSIIKSNDVKMKINFIMSGWLPLASSVLDMVIKKLPPPNQINEERARKLMCTATQSFESLPSETQKLKKAFMECNKRDAPLIVYVSKMFEIDKSCILRSKTENCPSFNTFSSSNVEGSGRLSLEEIEQRRKEILERNKRERENLANQKDAEEKAISNLENNNNKENNDDNNDEEKLIAFARVFSGTLTVGSKVYILGPKHNPHLVLNYIDCDGNLTDEDMSNLNYIHVGEVKSIYLLMGRHLKSIKTAPAGYIVGIGGLEGIHKSATVSSTAVCPPFTELTMHSTPILRVAVEPEDPKNLNKLRKGLKILDHADPCVQIEFKDSGEYHIIASGQVHLERCVSDLEERYGGIAVSVSEPIVPFRETIIEPPKVDRLNEQISNENMYSNASDKKNGIYEVSNHLGALKILAVPLPKNVTSILEKNSDILNMICAPDAEISDFSESNISISDFSKSNISLSTSPGNISITPESKNASKFSKEAYKAINDLKSKLSEAFKKEGDFWSEAIDEIWSFGPNYKGCNILLNRIPNYSRPSLWPSSKLKHESDKENNYEVYDSNFITGFQIATAAGPLCEEPMMGVCFIVQSFEMNEKCVQDIGQIIPLTKEAFRKAFENGHQRLMCAMYSCIVSITSEVIGKFYNLIGKRHGRVIDGDLTEGSTSWNVTTFVPVVESFNLASELRKCTSGEAIPQLMFSHWEILDYDPYWEPQTTEEIIHWGEKGDTENLAMKYITNVCRRKGLPTLDKIVQFAEKQRNISKNK